MILKSINRPKSRCRLILIVIGLCILSSLVEGVSTSLAQKIESSGQVLSPLVVEQLSKGRFKRFQSPQETVVPTEKAPPTDKPQNETASVSTKPPTPNPTSDVAKHRPTAKPSKIKSGKGVSSSPIGSSSLLSSTEPKFDARDVTYFLEGHPAHSVHDPRAYFTEEKTTRSLSILLRELPKIPLKLRFAFVARTFSELGRKIASKLNRYATEVAAILRKTPDDLGNKPEVSMLVDVIINAFESKLDNDSQSDATEQSDKPLTKLIGSDAEKAAVYDAAKKEVSLRLANLIAYFTHQANKTSVFLSGDKSNSMSSYLCGAMQSGFSVMIHELDSNDRFKVNQETFDAGLQILHKTSELFKGLVNNPNYKPDLNVKKSFDSISGTTFADLNQLTDQTGLIGAWNTYLFANLGSAERVIKLLGSLLSRVPLPLKTRWLNMYMTQVNSELQRALSGFVIMQGMPHNKNSSESYLLDPIRSVAIMPQKLPVPRTDYTSDKNRIPARCYLAGRRWRLVISRSLENDPHMNEFLDYIADRIAMLKKLTVGQSGNEFYRLCMPRLESGIRGWDINGEPVSGQENKFPLKNPIDNLNNMNDPFVSGVNLGYNLGFKLAFNEERNATLMLEATGTDRTRARPSDTEKFLAAIHYLEGASVRRATTVAAQRAYPVAIREGYLSSLKISFRSGILIPTEAGSRLASLKCENYGHEAGMQEARSVATSYLASKNFSDDNKQYLIKMSEDIGSIAGSDAGKVIGAIIGKEAAEEAYKRGIIRGGKVGRAKFHLDEYSAGAKLGFNHGLREGKRVASSSSLDPSAPRFFRFSPPVFYPDEQTDDPVDQWEKDLVPLITRQTLDDMHKANNHTLVRGSMRGVYMASKETKRGFSRISYTNVTYDLELFADGFIRNNVAYLSLNGTMNNMGLLKGSLIARDIFNDDKV